MKNIWKSIVLETFLYVIPLSIFLELIHADWTYDNVDFFRFLFYFVTLDLFTFLKTYFTFKAKENHLKEWENK